VYSGKIDITCHYMEKYVLFIPEGGINDIFSGILRLVQYCKNYNRTLLVLMKHSCYRIEFNDYFELEDMGVRIVFDTNQIKDLIRYKTIHSKLDIHLSQLIDSTDYKQFGIYWKGDSFYYRDILLRVPPYVAKEDLLFEVSCGEGYGIHLFKKLILKESLKEMCRTKMSRLKDYLCIQVRCTDYRSDYETLYEENKELIHSYPEVYVATDQKEAVQYFKSKGLNVFCFTTFPEGSYYNLHYSTVDPPTRFCDVIVDIFMATNSREILSNSQGWFIQLLRDCFTNKECILEKLI